MVTHPYFIIATNVVPKTSSEFPPGGPAPEMGVVQMAALDSFPNGARIPFLKAAPSVVFAHNQPVSQVITVTLTSILTLILTLILTFTRTISQVLYIGEHNASHFFLTAAADGIIR